MFQVKILDVKKVLYDDLADGVYFNIDEQGQIGILTNHINEEFKVSPSCLYVFNKDQKIKFYVSYGYAKMFSNVLELAVSLVTTSMEDFKLGCESMGFYGESCLNNFVHINL